jgi:hypothetical protein
LAWILNKKDANSISNTREEISLYTDSSLVQELLPCYDTGLKKKRKYLWLINKKMSENENFALGIIE